MGRGRSQDPRVSPRAAAAVPWARCGHGAPITPGPKRRWRGSGLRVGLEGTLPAPQQPRGSSWGWEPLSAATRGGRGMGQPHTSFATRRGQGTVWSAGVCSGRLRTGSRRLGGRAGRSPGLWTHGEPRCGAPGSAAAAGTRQPRGPGTCGVGEPRRCCRHTPPLAKAMSYSASLCLKKAAPERRLGLHLRLLI